MVRTTETRITIEMEHPFPEEGLKDLEKALINGAAACENSNDRQVLLEFLKNCLDIL